MPESSPLSNLMILSGTANLPLAEEMATLLGADLGSITSRRFADPKAALSRALGVTMTPFILRMALRESIGIYGLVLATLGHPIAHAAPFFAVSFLTQALAFPKLSGIADDLEAAQNASLGTR